MNVCAQLCMYIHMYRSEAFIFASTHEHDEQLNSMIIVGIAVHDVVVTLWEETKWTPRVQKPDTVTLV